MSSDSDLIDLQSPMPDRLRCVMSLRGCGDGPYGGFNVCHYVGDRQEHVAESRRVLSEVLGIGLNRMVIPRLTHSLNVAVIDNDSDLLREYDNVDALVTKLSRIALCINTADCAPVILSDTVHGVVAVAHSGWRGTVGRIAARTLKAMVSQGASVSDIDVSIGACICPDCFEVGEYVASKFRQEFPDDDGRIVRSGYIKPHVDIAAAIRRTLVEAGVRSGRIVDACLCSRCGRLPLFSARRDGIESGRTLTAAMLL